MTTEQKLARLHNRTTRYELIAERNGHKVLIGYTPRKNRQGLFSMLQQALKNGFYGLLFDVDTIDFAKRAADGGMIGDWRVRFSGRTQRDSIIEGEHLFIGDIEGHYNATEIGYSLYVS